MWERLIGVLAKMLELYQALLVISKQKHDILVSAKAVELEAITKQEELLIVQIGKIETARENAIQEIIDANKIVEDHLTVSRLAQLAEEPFGVQLSELLEKLQQVTAELVRMNQINTKLIEQSLSYINFNLNLLTQNTIGPTYAAKGQQSQASPNRAMLDRKV
jgi:flagellar biosynthesis/type III secretory pathway chaperone